MTDIPRPGSTPISTITGDPVVRVPADATVADVARAIANGGVGVVVIGEEARPTALVSERDVVRVVAEGRDPAAVPATEVATTKLVWCSADTTVDEAAMRMMEHYIRHILVEHDGTLIGVTSARDLLGVYAAAPDED